MKIKLILGMILINATVLLGQEGIKFHQGTFEEAKQKAKEENKPLFIDFYTSWCGPCKKLSKLVFPDENVGNYFNDKFVNFKIQTDEKGSNNELIADHYNITSYPTLIWISGSGELLHISIGYKDAEDLIKEGQMVFDEKNRVGEVFRKWKNGDRTPEVVQRYFLFDQNANNEFDSFFDTLDEETKKAPGVFDVILNIRLKENSKTFLYLVRNRQYYFDTFGEFACWRVIDNKIEKHFIKEYGKPNYEELVKQYKDLGIEKVDYYNSKAQWMYYLSNEQFKKFEIAAKKFIKTYSPSEKHIYREMITDMFDYMSKVDYTKFENSKIALKWVKKFKSTAKSEGSYLVALVQANIIASDFDKARKLGNDYIKKVEGSEKFEEMQHSMYIKILLDCLE